MGGKRNRDKQQNKKKWKLSCHKADIQEASGSRPE